MHEELKRTLATIVNQLTVGNEIKTGTVNQIFSYKGEIFLTQFLGFTVATHQGEHSNCGHIFMLTEKIYKIKQDYKIVPKIIFSLKIGHYAKVEGTGPHKIINITEMSENFFNVFRVLQGFTRKTSC